jgi:two-component system, cell cycle sensor histidine kinase and response regulator CckA
MPKVATSNILAKILASAPDYVLVVDLSGVIEYANRVDPPLTPEQVVGTEAWRHLGLSQQRVREELARAVESGTTIEHEVVMQMPSGERWFRVRMRAVTVRHGKRVVAFASDITDARNAQIELERTRAELEESRHIADHAQRFDSLGRLAGGVAHDFNNLLTSIISFSRFVMDDLSPNDPRRADLAEVLRAADSAARLTGQLLAFSRRRPVEPRLVDLGPAVSSLAQIVGRVVGETVRVELELPERPVHTVIDPGQLDQLLMNLAVNAKDAMPGGGTLKLSIREEHLTAHPVLAAGRYAILTFSDTGAGMTTETLRRAFEPFFTTKGEHGTGLGLATCYGIASQAGGHIALESELGRGTIVTIALPASCASTQVDAVAPASDAQRSRRLSGLALIVEDQPPILRSISRALKRLGFQVLESGTAEEAMSLVESLNARVDLLVTDAVLPGASGITLAERLSARVPDLRVLVCSGYLGDDLDMPASLRRSAAFLAKPFTGPQLASKVSALYT